MSLRALILVGGYGTRLRPLTFTRPKPLVPLVNVPMLFRQILALRSCGVDHVVLAVSYKPAELVERVAEFEKEFTDIKITLNEEDEPLGTAGPIGLARDLLKDTESFFVLNSDVICSFPFEKFLAFHKNHGGDASILTTPVEDPSKYGVVVTAPDDSGRIERFVEKPQTYVGNQINAGLYLLSPKVLDRIENRPTSIEREIFPALAADKVLYAQKMDGFWMDVGQPPDYLTGTRLYLAHCRQLLDDGKTLSEGDKQQKFEFAKTNKDYEVEGNVVVHPTASVGVGSKLGPNVVVGKGCVVGKGVRLANCVLLEESGVECHANVQNTIVGWESKVQRWGRLEGLCVLGQNVTVKEGVHLVGTRVCPHKTVKENTADGTVIL